MTWADFYLICFAVGFCFSFFSFILGGSRLGKLHLPHFHGHTAAHFPTHAGTAHSTTGQTISGSGKKISVWIRRSSVTTTSR